MSLAIDYFIVNDEGYLTQMSVEEYNRSGEVYGLLRFRYKDVQIGGYYDNYQSNPFETGSDMLTYYASYFLEVIEKLEDKDGILLNQGVLEDYYHYLVFQKVEDKLYFNIIELTEGTKQSDVKTIFDDKLVKEYLFPIDTWISMDEYCKEVLHSTRELMNDIEKNNPKLLDSKRLIKLKERCNEIEKDHVYQNQMRSM